MQVALCIEMNILCMIMLSVMAYTAARFELDSTAQTRTFTIAIWSAFAMHLCRRLLGAGLVAHYPHARLGAARYKCSVFYHALLRYVFLVCVFGIYVLPRHAAQTHSASSACHAARRAHRAVPYQSVHGLFIHVRPRFETHSRTALLYAVRAGGFVPLIIRSAVSRAEIFATQQ